MVAGDSVYGNVGVRVGVGDNVGVGISVGICAGISVGIGVCVGANIRFLGHGFIGAGRMQR